MRLGEILMRAGVLREEQLNEALEKQKDTREPIGEILTKLGYVTEEKIRYALELQFGVKHVNLKQARISPEVLRLLPEPMMRQYQLLPIMVNQLTVALVDPNNILAIDEIRKRLRGVNVVPAVCTESDFWETMKALPKDVAPSAPEPKSAHSHEVPSAADTHLNELLERAAKPGGEAAIVPLVNAILGSAVKRRASSLYIEPMENEFVLRYRVDGHLQREPGIPAKVGQAMIARLKILAELNVTAATLPQAGAFTFSFENRPVKVAFNTMPARHGAVMTMRFFDSALLSSQSLENLVLHPRAAATLRSLLSRPSGLLLFTGPRNAGKSLLMYSCLKELQAQGGSAITLEEPIEFDLDGITQVSVASESGPNDLSVMAGLNAALAQGADAVMVSDVATAAVAQRLVRGALAGSLILGGVTSTQGVLVEALESWGLPARQFGNAVAGLVTQRLVRRLCPACKESYTPDERTAKFFARFNGSGQVMRAHGCEACFQTGFSGQMGVYEVVPFTPPVRDLVSRNAPKSQIDHMVRQMGLLTLEDYAMWLVSQGHTTFDEVKKSDIHELAQAGQGAPEAQPV